MISVALMVAALVFACAATYSRGLTSSLDIRVVLWLASVTAWPIVVIYTVAPLVWGDAAAAGSLFGVITYLPAVGFSVYGALRAFNSGRPQVDPSAAIIAALMVFAAAAMVIDGSQRMINMMMAAGLFAGFVLRDRSMSLSQLGDAARVCLTLTALGLSLTVLVNASATVGSCRVDKCNSVAAVLTSPFAGNGNLAGILVATLLPMAVSRVSLYRVISAIISAGLIGVFAGSRTALVGIAMAAVVGVFLSFRLTAGWNRLLLSLALVGGGAYSLIPFYMRYSLTDFSLRGFLWNEAERNISGQLFFGHNPAFWVESGRSLLFKANYSPHNGWLEILVSVGLWGLILIVSAAVVKVMTLRSTETREYLLAYFAVILCLSSLEAVYVPYYLGIAPFAALIPYFLYDLRKVPAVQDEPAIELEKV